MSGWRNAANTRADIIQFMRDCLGQDEAEVCGTYLSGTTYRAFADLGIAGRRLGQEVLFAWAPTWYLKMWVARFYEERDGYSHWWS